MSASNSAGKTDEINQDNSFSLPPKKRLKSNDKGTASTIDLPPLSARGEVATPQGSLLLRINLQIVQLFR